MLLAGDIGGTKTNLALFALRGKEYAFEKMQSFPSQEHQNLESIVQEFQKVNKQPIEAAAFAIAGPVEEGVCRTTNLPWVVDAKELSNTLSIPNVSLLNDLEANAYALEILPESSLLELYPGQGTPRGNRAVISPGTGLGEAGLYWDGKRHHPFASEGGHTEFGPRDALEIQICEYLFSRFGHASYERILSGPGIHTLFEFYRDVQKMEVPDWLEREMNEEDPSKAISVAGLEGTAPIATETLNRFASLLGGEAGNLVLKYMAYGGIYLGGGIPPKILSKLKEPLFLEGFLNKGRMRPIVERTPIHVILDDKASLKGAAHYCRLQLGTWS